MHNFSDYKNKVWINDPSLMKITQFSQSKRKRSRKLVPTMNIYTKRILIPRNRKKFVRFSVGFKYNKEGFPFEKNASKCYKRHYLNHNTRAISRDFQLFVFYLHEYVFICGFVAVARVCPVPRCYETMYT